MRIFLLDRSWTGGDTYQLKAREVRYLINVLRLKPGDRITARDTANRYYLRIVGMHPDWESCLIMSRGARLTLGYETDLAVEDVARMACEEGVDELVFVSSAYTQEKTLSSHSIERIQAIIREASQQSGSETGTDIRILTFQEALDEAAGRILILHQSRLEETVLLRQALEGLDVTSRISLFVGSEGGFSDEECRNAQAKGAVACLMPTNILRAETAGIFALGAIENILCSDG